MKYLKHIVLSIMVILIVVVSLFNNRLSFFASEQAYNPTTLKSGAILKSGDHFTFDFQSDEMSYCKEVPIYLYINHNDISYSNYITSDTGTLKNDLNYYANYAPVLNGDAFKQDKIGTLPYVEDKIVLWEYNGKYELGGYCFTDALFFGTIYEEPKFELFCDSTEMGADDKVACQVAVEYSHIPDNVQFELSSDKFNISDITTLDGWKKTDDDDDKFIFESDKLPENEYDDSRVSVDIIEFYITPKDKENINVEDAVKVTKVAWKDKFAEKEIDSELIEPMKKKEEVKFEIPKTGVESYILIGILA